MLVRYEGGAWFRVSELPGMHSQKSFILTLILAFVLPGLDRIYLGKYFTGILKLVTFGGLGLWYLIDLIMILTNHTRDSRGLPLRQL